MKRGADVLTYLHNSIVERRAHWKADALLMRQGRPFGEWADHIKFALKHITHAGLYCEFGVYRGGLMNYFLEWTGQNFHGFDSFIGLPEDWLNFKAGHLAIEQAEIPTFPPGRVTLHKGWFADTLPVFVANYREPVAFMHVDCDLYSSTKTIFEHLRAQIIPGTVIVFDEYITGIDDERKAFLESGLRFEYLSRHYKGGSVAVQIKR